jgi:hypothetical protein
MKNSLFCLVVVVWLCSFQWPAYNPTLNYNFRNEFPSLEMPSKDLDDCSNVSGSISSGWWTFRWGPNKRSIIDSACVLPMLYRMNVDFAYFRDSLGWPPDKRAKVGYRSTIYLYGSGLCTDDKDSTALGGWQSAVRYNGAYYPMVLISYYPVYSYHPDCTFQDKEYQMSAVVHEGIHSVLADLPGCKKAAWFQEGGNTWLQQEADSRRTGNYSTMGFLNAASFVAPFMPIECYSGWLQDGSFGGPSAEGVNMVENGKQLCTWRNLLGGVQYSNIFPTFLGMTLGTGSVAWIWRNCPDRVLEGMAAKLGDEQIRQLIVEYRAKQALIDFGPWSEAIRKLISNNMGIPIRSEWKPCLIEVKPWKATPYVATSLQDGWLKPDSVTLPGWSGANQIPFHVEGKEVEISFKPIGQHLVCQLCYRNKQGKAIYSRPVTSGRCRLKIEDAPANGVVIAVITNTDYIYNGEETRKARYDYRVRPEKGVLRTADLYKKWFE